MFTYDCNIVNICCLSVLTNFKIIDDISFSPGNQYGTPKPSKEPYVSLPQSIGAAGVPGSGANIVFPGAHPSSEGKRKRNRSNVEAMAAKSVQDQPSNGPNSSGKLF